MKEAYLREVAAFLDTKLNPNGDFQVKEGSETVEDLGIVQEKGGIITSHVDKGSVCKELVRGDREAITYLLTLSQGVRGNDSKAVELNMEIQKDGERVGDPISDTSTWNGPPAKKTNHKKILEGILTRSVYGRLLDDLD